MFKRLTVFLTCLGLLVACFPSPANLTGLQPTTSPKVAISSTMTPSVNLPATETSAPPPTELTPDPTQQAEVLDLFQHNDSCRLPCWWGMQPGQTRWADVQNFVESLNGDLVPFPGGDDLTRHTLAGFDLEQYQTYNRVEVVERRSVVEWIEASGGGFNGRVDGFHQVWASYSPGQILREYGRPDRIWVTANCCFGRSGIPYLSYSFWLLYDGLGFMIRYDAYTDAGSDNGNSYQLCPNFKEASNDYTIYLEMSLQSPSSRTPLDQYEEATKDPERIIRPIDVATGLSIGEVYDLFISTSSTACFETPQNLWK